MSLPTWEPVGTPPHSRFPNLDGYRAIAALMVLVLHVTFITGESTRSSIGAMIMRFDFGVTLFFVISGFLLYRPWAHSMITRTPAPATGRYFVKRFMRIFPPLIPVVLVAAWVMPRIVAEVQMNASIILSNLTLTQIYAPGLQIRGLTQLWSLATELSFYIFLPIFGYVMMRRKTAGPAAVRWQLFILVGLILVGIAASVFRSLIGISGPVFLGFWLPAFLDWFAVGMIFAVLHEARQNGIPLGLNRVLERLASDPLVPLGLAIAVMAIAMTPIAGPYILAESTFFADMTRHYLYLLAATLFLIPGIAGPQHTGRWRAFLQTPAMIFLGQISYGIFLWHNVVIEVVVWLFGWNDFQGYLLLALPIVVAFSVLLGWLSWVVIERPAIAWSHRRRGKPTRPQPQTPSLSESTQ